MADYDGGGQEFDGFFHNYPNIGHGSAYSSLAEFHPVDDPVGAVEEEYPEFFMMQVGQQRLEYIGCIFRAFYLSGIRKFGDVSPSSEFEGGAYGYGSGRTDAPEFKQIGD